MNKLPPWAKILAAVALVAVLFGAARLMLWFDQMGGASKFGMD